MKFWKKRATNYYVLKTKVAVATNFSVATQNANTCSDSTIKALGKGVKYVQS